MIKGNIGVHAKDKRGQTALQLACEHCHTKSIRFLVNERAQVSEGNPSSLQMATKRADPETFKLVKSKAEEAQGDYGFDQWRQMISGGKKHRVLYPTEDGGIEVREYSEPGPRQIQGYRPQYRKQHGDWAYGTSSISTSRQKNQGQREILPYSSEEIPLRQAGFPIFW